MKETLEQLDFETYKDSLKRFSPSKFSDDFIDHQLKPLLSINDILSEQKIVEEAINIFKSFDGALPDSKDYYTFYQKLMDPFSSWLIQDLLVFGEYHRQLGEFKKKIFSENQINHLKTIFANIYTLGDIVDNIFDKVSADGSLKDHASEKLFDIRTELKAIKAKLYQSLNRILNSKDAEKFVQEKVIKEYNHRLVLLLKPNFRQYLEGIVHSISSSGLTMYVEPSSNVDMNNRYQELLSLEELEIRKILLHLLDSIRSHLYEITETVKSITKIYFYYAIFQYVGNRRYTFPIFSSDLLLEQIHHPLILDIKQEQSVPINFNMDKNTNVAIITGPNAGGKTAALKSIGLNCIIAKCGLPIFAKYAEIINFESIYADIGDQQSLIMDLSTFTSHMVNIKNILENVDNRSLILLDELGTGTDPKEGEALALSIIKYLQQIGSKVIITTHFNGVRNLGLRDKGVMLYGVDFNYDTFEPKFVLIKNLMAKSDPLIIATKLNFKKSIIEEAYRIINEYKSFETLTLEELNEIKLKIEYEKKQLEEERKQINQQKQELHKKEEEFKKLISQKESEILKESLNILKQVKTIKTFPKDEVDSLKKQISSKLNLLEQNTHILDIKEGDLIKLNQYNKVAKVLEINKNKVLIDLDGLKLTLDIKDLKGEKITTSEPKDSSISVKTSVLKSPKYEIVLIGKTVEEAWDELDKFIDKALISGWDKIYVIHGRGTGALKKGLQNLLKSDKRVKSFRIADLKEGGNAITIVEL
ncbi:MAG: Smr/MutS family protein [Calditerrivibrio sp.]|nr:Smr/MutS family protein [Calditerrivibrio sp.]